MGHISQDTNGVHCTYLLSQKKIQKCALINHSFDKYLLRALNKCNDSGEGKIRCDPHLQSDGK